MHRHCIKCAQKPELWHTGKSENDAQWYCIVCKTSYYVDKDGKLLTERPFSWPATVPKAAGSWEISKEGYWTKTA